jgi:UDPglucose 6-dehydrogenase
MMRIAVAGLGYVGLSNAILLARFNSVTAVDRIPEKVAMVQEGRSPIEDSDCIAALARGGLNLTATLDGASAWRDAEIVIIATPTNYDPETNAFDTSSIEAVARDVIAVNPEALIVIKSTIPVGYTRHLRGLLGTDKVIFSPEFLREGSALHDNLHPSRIVVGEDSPRGAAVAALLREAALASDVPVLLTGMEEAESIKLFANTHLAMRVAFFNELDSYALGKGLDARQILEGVGLDPRIGTHYANPSFGYGGYCLPKDTRQLLANYQGVPQNLIRAIIEANATRKSVIVDAVMARGARVVGLHRLAMKQGSDNFRESAILDILEALVARGVRVLVYEPAFQGAEIRGASVESDLAVFKVEAELILANRMHADLDDVSGKVFTRDIFGEN